MNPLKMLVACGSGIVVMALARQFIQPPGMGWVVGIVACFVVGILVGASRLGERS